LLLYTYLLRREGLRQRVATEGIYKEGKIQVELREEIKKVMEFVRITVLYRKKRKERERKRRKFETLYKGSVAEFE
jgi:hypothetical protein